MVCPASAAKTKKRRPQAEGSDVERAAVADCAAVRRAGGTVRPVRPESGHMWADSIGALWIGAGGVVTGVGGGGESNPPISLLVPRTHPPDSIARGGHPLAPNIIAPRHPTPRSPSFRARPYYCGFIITANVAHLLRRPTPFPRARANANFILPAQPAPARALFCPPPRPAARPLFPRRLSSTTRAPPAPRPAPDPRARARTSAPPTFRRISCG